MGNQTYSVNEIYFFEAQNILKASLDYLGGVSNKKSDSFDTDFFLKLHKAFLVLVQKAIFSLFYQ
jgi:hypothetical protein